MSDYILTLEPSVKEIEELINYLIERNTSDKKLYIRVERDKSIYDINRIHFKFIENKNETTS